MDKTNDLQYMKNYLFYAFKFESYVYLWKKAMETANEQMRSIDNERRNLITRIENSNRKALSLESSAGKEKEKIRQNTNVLKKIITIIAVLALVFGGLFFGIQFFSFLFGMKIESLWNIIAIVISALFTTVVFVLVPAGIIITILFVLYKNNKTKIEGNSMENSARRQKELALEEVEKMKLCVKQFGFEEQHIRENQQAIHKQLIEAEKQLSNIYCENILPVRYRSLETTGTLYGYIVDGRCTWVKGHGGIYDTFEADYKAGLIILELKKANEALSRIEDYQRVLFQEVKQINRNLMQMKESLRTIQSDVADIRCSAAISAVAQQQAATAMNYIAYYK